MSDLANWNVHGPVHTMRTEFAEWDLSLEQWQSARNSNLVRFHPDGRISESEAYNPALCTTQRGGCKKHASR